MEKNFRKVSVKERLPQDTDVYYTNVGKVPFFKGEKKLMIDTDQEILWWLEEIELPNFVENKKCTKCGSENIKWYLSSTKECNDCKQVFRAEDVVGCSPK